MQWGCEFSSLHAETSSTVDLEILQKDALAHAIPSLSTVVAFRRGWIRDIRWHWAEHLDS